MAHCVEEISVTASQLVLLQPHDVISEAILDLFLFALLHMLRSCGGEAIDVPCKHMSESLAAQLIRAKCHPTTCTCEHTIIVITRRTVRHDVVVRCVCLA